MNDLLNGCNQMKKSGQVENDQGNDSCALPYSDKMSSTGNESSLYKALRQSFQQSRKRGLNKPLNQVSFSHEMIIYDENDEMSTFMFDYEKYNEKRKATLNKANAKAEQIMVSPHLGSDE